MPLAEPPPGPPWREFARAPLVPRAVAVTTGLVADRTLATPWAASLAAGAAAVGVWLLARHRRSPAAAAWLLVAWAAGPGRTSWSPSGCPTGPRSWAPSTRRRSSS